MLTRHFHKIASTLLALSPLLLITGRAPVEIAMALIGLLFLVDRTLNKQHDWLKIRWVQISLALWGYLCLRNIFVEGDTEKAFLSGLVWIRYPIFAAALAYWILPDKTSQKWLIYGLIAAIMFFCLDGIYQYFMHTDLLGHELFLSADYLRLTGPFHFPRLGITIAWLFFPIIGFFLKCAKEDSRNAWNHLLKGFTFYLLSAGVIYLSGDRMAFIFMLFGSGLLWLFLPKLRRIAGIGMLFAALLLTSISLLDENAFQRQFNKTNNDISRFTSSGYGRSFSDGWELAKRHPFFGIGGKQYRTACLAEIKTIKEDALCGLHPHNFYLDWLAAYGFIGLAGMLALIILWLKPAFIHWRSICKDGIAAALLVTLIIRFWPIAGVTSQFTLWSAYPQFLMIGWFIAYINHHLSNPHKQ